MRRYRAFLAIAPVYAQATAEDAPAQGVFDHAPATLVASLLSVSCADGRMRANLEEHGIVALFGKKKPEEESAERQAPANGKAAGAPDPAKAQPWFERARTVHDAANYEYAVTCWLQGLRYDPSSVDALEQCFKSAASFLAGRKKPGPTKDQTSNFSGRSTSDRFLAAALEACTNPLDVKQSIRAMELAVKIDQLELAYWLGDRALSIALGERKPRKDLLVRIKDACKAFGAFDLALKAGEAAVRLDPADGQLTEEVKRIAAEATMARGGYEDTGQAGGFRRNIRDAEKQRRLDEESRLVRSEEATMRVIDAARQDYERRPDDLDAAVKYVRELRKTGKPEDEDRAIEILERAYDSSQQFRFRQEIGEIHVRQAMRKARALEKKAQAGDEEAATEFKSAKQALLKLDLQEHKLRMEQYPTDLSLKYETAKRLAALGKDEDAIPLLQQAQDDSRLRLRALALLGECFARAGFDQEAVSAFRDALKRADDASDDVVVALRYGLMSSLQSKAERLRDAEAAAEALDLASSIMLKQFNYRDIRERREGLQKLVEELRASA